MKNEKNNIDSWKNKSYLVSLIFLEVVLLILVLAAISSSVFAVVGTNVTVKTRLDVGNTYPEIINVSVNTGVTNINLLPNATVLLNVTAVARDFNGEGDLNWSTATFFDGTSTYAGADDNNNHYSNGSCVINTSYGDSYEALIYCSFQIWYYANNASNWNITVFVNDTNGLADTESSIITVNRLLALGLPDQIDYGTVNATNVSSEQIANVTNFGNSKLNLSLEGYAVNKSYGLAMNCTLGAVKNISIAYEKYNLTSSNTSVLSLTQFESGIYANLTNSTVIKNFGLGYRQNDAENDAINQTYWRIYVPVGVAGSCSGNIIFGATAAAGS